MIFYLSSRPELPVKTVFYGMDKVLHAVCYAVLGFFFSFSFKPREKPQPLIRVIVITLMVAVYGALDELHQSFIPGRDADIYDLAADAAGGLAAAVIFCKRQVYS